MSSGYGFWSDMSIRDFLNGKVKSVNNYHIWYKCLSRIIFYFLCIQISYVTNHKEKNMLFKKCCCFLFLNLKPRTGE